MSRLTILQWPDARLRTECRMITTFDADLATFAQDMLDTMYAAKGRGLAAPQVGVMTRMFVMDVGWKSGAPTPMVCINPTIAAIGSNTSTGEEQCLSIPDRPIQVKRFQSIRMRWLDLNGDIQKAELSDAAAIIAQHEADHLDGRLILDVADHLI